MCACVCDMCVYDGSGSGGVWASDVDVSDASAVGAIMVLVAMMAQPTGCSQICSVKGICCLAAEHGQLALHVLVADRQPPLYSTCTAPH